MNKMQKLNTEISYKQTYTKRGPMIQVAGVEISLSPANDYSFHSQITWPKENYSDAVEKGVIDGLLEIQIDPKLGIKINLLNIEFHEYSSGPGSFYEATKLGIINLEME